jgi:hypothetical protein
VASAGEGRAQETAMLCEMRRGSECGHWRSSKKGAGRVGRRRGQEIRRCARVRTCRSTARAGRAELTGRVHDAERERKKGARATAQRLAEWARETEREEGRARAKQLAPTGRPQWAESERERERGGEKVAADRRARLSGSVGARPGWAAFPFSFSLDFLIPFIFLFYRVFNPNSN